MLLCRGYGTRAGGRAGGNANTEAQQAARRENVLLGRGICDPNFDHVAAGRAGGRANTEAQQEARRKWASSGNAAFSDIHRTAALSRGADYARQVLKMLHQNGTLDQKTREKFANYTRAYNDRSSETACLFFAAAKPILLHAHETNHAVVLPTEDKIPHQKFI
jgi:hypothetical protein